MPGHDERLRLLRSLRLLSAVAEKDLSALGEFLKPVSLQKGGVIFAEGSRGQSLYFIAEGRVNISKRVSRGAHADLAVLGPGDCFGEMAVIEDALRSATASAREPCLIFELSRGDLKRWLKSRPDSAMEFFSRLVLVQSRRLRRTSNELALIFDLSQLFADRSLSSKELLIQAVARILSHLDGSWSAEAYFYNQFNEEFELAAASGRTHPDSDGKPVFGPADQKEPCRWISPERYLAWLPRAGQAQGCLIFHAAAPLEDEDRQDAGRTLAAAARLLAAAMENAGLRMEELLRERLKSAHGPSL